MTGKNVRQNREEFNRRVAMNKQGSDTDRKYLSEPPLELSPGRTRPPRPAMSARTSGRRNGAPRLLPGRASGPGAI